MLVLDFPVTVGRAKSDFKHLRYQAKPDLLPETVLNVFSIALPKSRGCNK